MSPYKFKQKIRTRSDRWHVGLQVIIKVNHSSSWFDKVRYDIRLLVMSGLFKAITELASVLKSIYASRSKSEPHVAFFSR